MKTLYFDNDYNSLWDDLTKSVFIKFKNNIKILI